MSSIQARLSALAIVAALLVVAAPAAHADKPYTVASLVGAYHFTLVEIAVTDDPEPATIYCNGYGRLVFDGAGQAEMEDSYSVCSDGEETYMPQEFSYAVEADGEVFLTATAEGSVSHCQLADRGALLLCDGTPVAGSPVPSEGKLWMATAAKLP